MWMTIISFIGSSVIKGLIDGYKGEAGGRQYVGKDCERNGICRDRSPGLRSQRHHAVLHRRDRALV
jgi:hypothetical protein